MTLLGQSHVYLRRFIQNTYRCIPGSPFKAHLARLDLWLKTRHSGKIVVTQRHGVYFELNLDQLIDSQLYYEGQFEPHTHAAFKNLLKPGMVAIDIGANIGAHGLFMAKLVGKQGRVYLIEPTDWAFNKLKRNLSLNPDIENAKINKIGLSDFENAEQEYHIRSSWKLSGEFSPPEHGVLEFTTLDRFCETENISKIDLIKIDVDGYETKIIKGGMKILNKYKPTLLIEMSDHWQKKYGNSIVELIGNLNSVGYNYMKENTNERIADIISYIRKLPGDSTENVICVPKNDTKI